MPLSFNMNNVNGLDDALAKAVEELEKKLGTAEAKGKYQQLVKPLTDDAKARINAITGNLTGGVKSYIETSADSPMEITLGVSYKRTRAHHAHLVEGGHGGKTAKAHPFWQPAVEVHLEEVTDAILEEVMDCMEEALE